MSTQELFHQYVEYLKTAHGTRMRFDDWKARWVRIRVEFAQSQFRELGWVAKVESAA